MDNRSVEELIGALYDMVQDAWNVPMSGNKCVLERDQVQALLDEISANLPGELKQARTIVETRSEVITNAKKEAENIRRAAEERGIRLAMLSDYYQSPREAPQHVLVVNYTGIDTEKLPTALARLAELWPS